jgi:hypothetical protein
MATAAQPAHDYATCEDPKCGSFLCIACQHGYDLGYKDGVAAGFAAGYAAGVAASEG